MAERALLHIDHYPAFVEWLNSQGIEHRPGKGDWQVLQIKTDKHGWQCVHSRAEMKEHFTVQDKLVPLVRRFIKHEIDDAVKRGVIELVPVTLEEINFKLDLIMDHLNIKEKSNENFKS